MNKRETAVRMGEVFLVSSLFIFELRDGRRF
jgi:hypothetical protein